MRRTLMILIGILFLVGCSSITNTDNDSNNLEVKNSAEPKETELTEPTTITDALLRVHFIDVGQGDSILIETPGKHYMLVDGGARGAGKDVVNYLGSLGIEKLDYVVATHPDADHIGGLIHVLNSIKIDNFMDSGKAHTSETYAEMLLLIESKNIPFKIAQKNEELYLDDQIQINVLSADENAKDNNEASIVLKVLYDEISFLLTGDAGMEMEKQMMATYNMRATILKAGHHGSNTSNTLPFIDAVHSEATILSYGQDNSYGHPHYEVIQNLQQIGSKIYGTAESGTIIVETDGTKYEVLADEWTGIGATSSIVPPPVKSDGKSKPSTSGVSIESLDLYSEVVAIKNNGIEEVNLSGWQLLSVEGNQLYTFPDIRLSSGDTIYITSGSDAKEGNDYIKWTGRQVWLNDGDTAQLINPKGEIVSER